MYMYLGFEIHMYLRLPVAKHQEFPYMFTFIFFAVYYSLCHGCTTLANRLAQNEVCSVGYTAEEEVHVGHG